MKLKIAGKVIEIADDVISKAIEEKTDVEVTDQKFVIRTEEEQTAYEKNIKDEHIKAGKEIGIKEIKTALGVEVEGKDVSKIADAFKVKVIEEAKINPDAKVVELTKDIETLKGTITSITGEKEQIANQFKSFKSESVLNNKLLSVLPENLAFPKDAMTLVIKNSIKTKVDEHGNVLVLDATGEIKKDPVTLNPVPFDSEVKSFFETNPTYLKGASGGAGGSDSGTGGGKKSIAKFTEEMTAKGIAPNSPEFVKEMEIQEKAGLLED